MVWVSSETCSGTVQPLSVDVSQLFAATSSARVDEVSSIGKAGSGRVERGFLWKVYIARTVKTP